MSGIREDQEPRFQIQLVCGGKDYELHFAGPLTRAAVEAIETNARLLREFFDADQTRKAKDVAWLIAMAAEYGPRSGRTLADATKKEGE